MRVTPILLHASKNINSNWKKDKYARKLFRNEMSMDFKLKLHTRLLLFHILCLFYRKYVGNSSLKCIEQLNRGSIVGVCLMSGPFAYEQELHESEPWHMGPICYQIVDVFRLSIAIQCKGDQGLWYPSQNIMHQIATQKVYKRKMNEWTAKFKDDLIVYEHKEKESMAALSIQQPWVEAILRKIKKVENRTGILFQLESKAKKFKRNGIAMCRFCFVEDDVLKCSYWAHGTKKKIVKEKDDPLVHMFNVSMYFAIGDEKVCGCHSEQDWIADLKFMNVYVDFDYHIGGFDITTGIRKKFVETKDWKKGEYINKNTMQVDEESVEELFNSLNVRRWAMIYELNQALIRFNKEYVCSQKQGVKLPLYLVFENKGGVFDLNDQKFVNFEYRLELSDGVRSLSKKEKQTKYELFEHLWRKQRSIGKMKEYKRALGTQLKYVKQKFAENAEQSDHDASFFDFDIKDDSDVDQEML